MQMAISLYGEEQAKSMSQQQLAQLGQQLADVRGLQLPDLPNITPDQLGDSAVGDMRSDENMRGRQMQAMAELQNIIDRGGLDLSDQAGLEEALNAATNQQHRARAGVAADAQARGQLNSGNRMMMDMDASQQGANAARQSGLEVAGMAQRRRLQAIQDASQQAGGMREQDWREHEASARAKDMRDERNAAAREKAQYYNAGIPQQQFTNALGKATGQLPSANAYAGALGAAATDTRQSAAGLGNIAHGAYDGMTRPSTTTNTYTYNPDATGDRGGVTDLSRDEDDK